MLNKIKYRELCRKEASIPIFSRDWWMDAACGSENWDVFIVESDGEIIAAMPHYLVKWHGFKYIKQPKLTPKNGIWIKYPEMQSYSRRLSYEKEVMSNIIEQMELQRICCYEQGFDYSVTNWLPFYWKGFEQTTGYTYVIEDLTDLDRVFSNFDHSKRKNVKRAKELVSVRTDLPAEDFYKNHQMTLAKQGKKISYEYELFLSLYHAAYLHCAGKVFYAVDPGGNIHAALFIVWDEVSAYDLISTIDPDFRNSGAASLLVQEAIRYVSARTTKFDFEGSMIENVENSFRKFGAVQKPYFVISKEFKTGIGWPLLKKLAFAKKKVLEALRRAGG